MPTAYKQFKDECLSEVSKQKDDLLLMELTRDWMNQANKFNYSYHFEWLGRPIIQYPPDIVAVQELIWSVKPDLIIETGIAHGGSIILSSSMLALLDYCDAIENNEVLNPKKPHRQVIGVDIDIRSHNRVAIENHPMSNRIHMIQGSSLDEDVIEQVRKYAEQSKCIMVFLDSMHTHDHVHKELEAYAPLVSPGSYCVVFDTIIEHFPKGTFSNRPWEKGNNPKTAVWQWLKTHPEFEIDKNIHDKLLITVAPDGYLRRLSSKVKSKG